MMLDGAPYLESTLFVPQKMDIPVQLSHVPTHVPCSKVLEVGPKYIKSFYPSQDGLLCRQESFCCCCRPSICPAPSFLRFAVHQLVARLGVARNRTEPEPGHQILRAAERGRTRPPAARVRSV